MRLIEERNDHKTERSHTCHWCGSTFAYTKVDLRGSDMSPYVYCPNSKCNKRLDMPSSVHADKYKPFSMGSGTTPIERPGVYGPSKNNPPSAGDYVWWQIRNGKAEPVPPAEMRLCGFGELDLAKWPDPRRLAVTPPASTCQTLTVRLSKGEVVEFKPDGRQPVLIPLDDV